MYPRTKGSFRLPELESLGWNDRLSSLYEPFAGDGVVAGRVSIQHRGAYDVLTELGELRCEVPRRLVHEAATTAELPGRRRLGRRRPRAPRTAGHDHGRPAPLHEVLAQDRLAGGRGAGAGGEHRRRLPRRVDERGPQPAPARALPDPRLGERRPAGDRADEGRPPPRSRGRPSPRSRRSPAACPCTRSRASPARASTSVDRAARPGPDGGAARLVGRRQVDARQHARGRGAARDTGDPRRRQGPSHDDPPRADPAPERRARDRHARESASCSSGSPTRASTRRSTTSRSCSPTAGSPTAPTTASPAAPSRPRSTTGRSPPSGGTAT